MTTYYLPSGGDGEKFITFSPDVVATFVEQRMVETEMQVFTIGDAPIGSAYLFNAPRQNGDWYCEIDGARSVCAIGQTRADAFRAAIAKARLSPDREG